MLCVVVNTVISHLWTNNFLLVFCKDYRSTCLLRHSLKYHTGLGSSLSDDNRHAFLHNTGFLHSYLLKWISQQLHVVVADIRYYREDGGDDIGTVKASSESYFYYGDIYRHVAEILEGHRRSHFKETGLQWLEEWFLFSYEVYDVILVDRLSVDTDTLWEIHQMGRCV